MPKTPFVPAINVIQLEAIANIAAQTCENVFHVQLAGPPDHDIILAHVNALIAWVRGDAVNLYHDGYGLEMVKGRDMTVQDGIGVEVTPAAPEVAGTDASGHLPLNVTLSIKHSTGLTGKSRRGRTYWLAVPRGALQPNANLVTAAYRDNVLASMGRMRTSLNAVAGGALSVVSKRHNNAYRDVALVTPVTNFEADQLVDSQRRRLSGRGQ